MLHILTHSRRDSSTLSPEAVDALSYHLSIKMANQPMLILLPRSKDSSNRGCFPDRLVLLHRVLQLNRHLQGSSRGAVPRPRAVAYGPGKRPAQQGGGRPQGTPQHSTIQL